MRGCIDVCDDNEGCNGANGNFAGKAINVGVAAAVAAMINKRTLLY